MRTKVALPGLLLCAAPALVIGTPAQALLCGSGLPLASLVTVTSSDLHFGMVNPASGATASAAISITCGLLGIDILPSFTLKLTAMNGTSPSARYLAMGSSHLGYNIYTDNGYGTVWGDGTDGSVTQSYDGTLLTLGSIGFTAWGKVPAGQFLTHGPYTDKITVTVSY